MSKVIVNYSDGCFSCYEPTLQNAKDIFEQYTHQVNSSAFEIAELIHQKKPYFNNKSIISIVNKVLSLPPGKKASKSITVTEDIKNETVLYCFSNKIKISNEQVSEYEFLKNFSFQKLSYFKNNPVYQVEGPIFDSYDIDTALSIYPIIYDSWKTNDELKKINYIISLVQELTNNESKFQLIDIKPTVRYCYHI